MFCGIEESIQEMHEEKALKSRATSLSSKVKIEIYLKTGDRVETRLTLFPHKVNLDSYF